MGSYLNRVLQDKEKVVYQSQLHWVIYLDGLFLSLLGAFLGHLLPPLIAALVGDKLSAYTDKIVSYASVIVVGLGAVQLLIAYIRQISTELAVTNQRVIAKHGFIATTSYELMLPKVEGATIEQSVLGRLLGYGTLMVKGTGGGISPIDHVADPSTFHTSLMNAVHAEQEKNGHHFVE